MQTNSSKSSSRSSELELINKLSVLLDNQFTLPGTNLKFGIDSLLGLVPGFGDVATSSLSAFLIYKAAKLGIKKTTILKMISNVLLDSSIGAIPVFGDIFDFAYKSNLKNLTLLNEELRNGGLVPRTDSHILKLMLTFGLVLLFLFSLVIATIIISFMKLLIS